MVRQGSQGDSIAQETTLGTDPTLRRPVQETTTTTDQTTKGAIKETTTVLDITKTSTHDTLAAMLIHGASITADPITKNTIRDLLMNEVGVYKEANGETDAIHVNPIKGIWLQ
ncbi:hypothetical protein NX059_001052 [Plenodomus lindquistii]|nr:hypothetical protein NX059_001052 [Plenodomus lindquistii]